MKKIKESFARCICLALVLTSIASFTVPSSAASGNIHDILFDWSYYVNKYPDLKAAFGNDSSALRRHWEQYGKREGRSPSILYDPAYYRDQHADLKAVFGNDYVALYNHLVSCGIQEGRDTSPSFHVEDYNDHEDLRKAFGTSGSDNWEYFRHYRDYGQAEGRVANRPLNSATSAGPASSSLGGTVTISTALNAGYYLDVNGNGSANGTNIQIFSKNGTAAQLFELISVGDSWFAIRHISSGKYLDVSGGSRSSQTNCQLYEGNGTDSQKWKFIPYGNGYLIQSKLGTFLDVSGGNVGDSVNVWLYSENRSQAQVWVLHAEKAASAPSTQDNGYAAYVKTSNPANKLNLRASASSSSRILDKLSFGTQVQVLSVSNSWAKVQVNGRTGYVSNQYLTRENPNVPANNDQQTGDGSWDYPMKDAYCTWSSYNNMSWGEHKYGGSGGRNYHLGLDLYGTNGVVYAAAEGKVVKTGYNNANGNFVILQHQLSGKTVYSFYAHLAQIRVSEGNTVSKGRDLGIAGSTGSSTSKTHLHFAVADTLSSGGGYWGYATQFSGNSVRYDGITYYNPNYIVANDRLP